MKKLLLLLFVTPGCFIASGKLHPIIEISGDRYYHSDTLDFSNNIVVIKPGTTLHFNDSVQDGKPIRFLMKAYEIIMKGEVNIVGIGEKGQIGRTGSDCPSCQTEGASWQVSDWDQYNNACNGASPSSDLGERGGNGGDGGSGASVVLQYRKLVRGKGAIAVDLKGGPGGDPGQGGGNRSIHYTNPRDANDQKYCKGGRAAAGSQGATGTPGSFSLVRKHK